jgi:hypothetical protein
LPINSAFFALGRKRTLANKGIPVSQRENDGAERGIRSQSSVIAIRNRIARSSEVFVFNG